MAERFLRIREVMEKTGLARTTIYEQMAAGRFPKPIPLTESRFAVAWLQSEIEAWQQARIENARGKAAA